MSETVDTLFASFRQRCAEGARPSVREWLERADRLGADARPELARRIDAFLAAEPLSAAAEPPVEPLAEVLAEVERIIAAAGFPAPPARLLIDLRVARGLRRQEVVAALVDALSLKRDLAARVAAYYHELEAGLLDPARVSRRVWEALAAVLGVDEAGLRSLSPASPLPAFAAEAYLRAPAARRLEDADVTVLGGPAAAGVGAADGGPAAGGAAAASAADEVDRLFTGGP